MNRIKSPYIWFAALIILGVIGGLIGLPDTTFILIFIVWFYYYYKWLKKSPHGQQWTNKWKKRGEDFEQWAEDRQEKAAQQAEERRKIAAQETITRVGYNTVRKRADRTYYISPTPMANPEELYTFEGFSHSGSTFKTVSRTTGNVKKQGRAGSALVGGVLFGPVGAIAGASRKKKDRINQKTTHEERERKGSVTISLRNIETMEIKNLSAKVTDAEALNIERFFN